MPAMHDRGGWPAAGPIDKRDHRLADWERHTDAIMELLWSPQKRVIRVDEMRRAIEGLAPEEYESFHYYERWAHALETLTIEKNILTKEAIDQQEAVMGGAGATQHRTASPEHAESADHMLAGLSSPAATRVEAIEALLVEMGVLTQAEVRRTIADFAARTPAIGARLVARAWVDPAFKARLLANAKAAAAELGIDASRLVDLVVVENTAAVHHLVVCTLCSCSPRAILGSPPDWYKSLSYRSRAVVDPRGVMREFGLELGENVAVRVLDTTTEVRYLVLPRRPAGTENLTEPELAQLVTWESMIGVLDPVYEPAAAGRSPPPAG